MSLVARVLVALSVRRRRRQAGLVRRKRTIGSGETYVYLDSGERHLPPLLMLHGFGANKDNFVPIAPHLRSHFRIVSPDHIGFGESDRLGEADYSPIAQARRLHAFVEDLGLGPVDLAGSSMGGHIAMTFAALYPDDVKTLWLLDAGGAWSAPESELHRTIRETGRNMLVARNVDEFAGVLGFVMHRPPRLPRMVLEVLARERIVHAELDQRIFEEASADSVEARVTGLPVRTLITWGAEDRVISPSTADLLRRLMPNSRVVMMPSVGHLPMIESPRQCAADYLAFQATGR